MLGGEPAFSKNGTIRSGRRNAHKRIRHKVTQNKTKLRKGGGGGLKKEGSWETVESSDAPEDACVRARVVKKKQPCLC